MPVSLTSPTSISPTGVNEVMVLCAPEMAMQYRAPLQASCRVSITDSLMKALSYMDRAKVPLFIIDGDHEHGPGDACRRVREVLHASPSTVLVTMSNPALAGDAIDVCNSILLKPFAPNLLASRVARLLRLHLQSLELRRHSQQLLDDAQRQRAVSAHLKERRAAGTLIEWNDAHCPYCDHNSIVLFDYADHRRAWYACAACRKAWVGRRLEQR